MKAIGLLFLLLITFAFAREGMVELCSLSRWRLLQLRKDLGIVTLSLGRVIFMDTIALAFAFGPKTNVLANARNSHIKILP